MGPIASIEEGLQSDSGGSPKRFCQLLLTLFIPIYCRGWVERLLTPNLAKRHFLTSIRANSTSNSQLGRRCTTDLTSPLTVYLSTTEDSHT